MPRDGGGWAKKTTPSLSPEKAAQGQLRGGGLGEGVRLMSKTIGR